MRSNRPRAANDHAAALAPCVQKSLTGDSQQTYKTCASFAVFQSSICLSNSEQLTANSSLAT